MVDFADAAIGNFTSALKDKKMWDQSILVFSAVSTSVSVLSSAWGASQAARDERGGCRTTAALSTITARPAPTTVRRHAPHTLLAPGHPMPDSVESVSH